MEVIAPGELMKELSRWWIKCKVIDWRIELYDGVREARERYDELLSQDEDLEAKLILYISNTDKVLHELIEERAAIRWTDGLPGDLLSAVRSNMGVKD